MELKSQSKLFLFIQMLFLGTLVQSTNYVKIDDSSQHDCPKREPCLTFNGYINESKSYFITGSTFVFLPGNHSQQNSFDNHIINISDISDMIWKGNESKSNNVIIISNGSFHFYNVTNFTIEGLSFIKLMNTSIFAFTMSTILLSSSVFQGSVAATGRTVYSERSNITIMNTTFEGNRGGAIMVKDYSTLKLTGTTFIGNEVVNGIGSAICALSQSYILLNGAPRNLFSQNHSKKRGQGGAIWCQNCTINMASNNIFENNRASEGGAVFIWKGSLTIADTANFSENKATFHGGALYLEHSHGLINEAHVNFYKNRASFGGAAIIALGSLNITGTANFSENIASRIGGALYLTNSQVLINGTNISFSKNLGYGGGGLFIEYSSVLFERTNTFSENHGGIYSLDASLVFSGNSLFYNNTVHDSGGAIISFFGDLSFTGNTSFINNSALKNGGAIYASQARVMFDNTVIFLSNSAQNGGAMYLINGATLTLRSHANLNMSYNRATDYGGAIYHKDIVTPDQCKLNNNIVFPNCFLQFITERGSEIKTIINSYYNSAGKGGNFLHGGLLDRCRLGLYTYSESRKVAYDYLIDEGILSLDNRTEQITSEPLQLSFCYNNTLCHKCEKKVELQRGQELNVSLLALGQRSSITPTNITAVGKNIRFKQNQTSQTLSRQCTSLYYNLYSSSESGKLELYPDGPCRDTGLAKAIIQVIFLTCPDGFSQQGEECACEKRLQNYDAQCINGKQSFIRRKNTSTFWMNVLRSPNDSYLGLILYRSCPHDYCTTDSVDISLDDLDIQCSPHRTGVLCGECTNNYSLMLGGSRCAQCSHNYLSLLIPFALAGIVLVVFLSLFRLTVAYGMINSLILYANIVQVNRRLFFSTDTVNILTVFIAWLNLDLGFQTCFFNGLDAYLQTWLQFAFPLYVWLLIIVIIITSRYSMTVSKLIGTNPISVLATLILMSYTKILQVIIGVFSLVNLDYPHDKKVRVWLKDANVHYLHSKHLFLAVMTVMVVIFFLLPYTLFLLLGPRAYRISPRKCIHLLAWIKPLLDSYYAPYKKNTRYWTGFLLVIRCILYIVFSYNSLRDINKNLLAIVITFTGIGFIAWISGRVYKSFIVELIERFIYINLIILSAATLTQVNKTALVNALVGTIFAAMIAITISQFYLLYVSKTNLWLKIKRKVSDCLPCLNKKIKDAIPAEVTPPKPPEGRVVTQTLIELREPLLEN